MLDDFTGSLHEMLRATSAWMVVEPGTAGLEALHVRTAPTWSSSGLNWSLLTVTAPSVAELSYTPSIIHRKIVPRTIELQKIVPRTIELQKIVPQIIELQNKVPQIIELQNIVPQIIDLQNRVPKIIELQNIVPQIIELQNTYSSTDYNKTNYE